VTAVRPSVSVGGFSVAAGGAAFVLSRKVLSIREWRV